MKRQTLGVALLLLCITGASAHADETRRLRVAVAPVAAINVDWEQAEVHADALRQALRRVLAVDVVTREEMQAALGAPVPDSCMNQPDCIRALGAALSAQEVLFVAIVQIGRRTQVNVTWADTDSAQTETRAPIRLDSGADMGATFEREATRLLPRAAPTSDERSANSPPAVTTRGTPAASAPNGDAPMPPSQDSGTASSGRRVTTGVWIAGGVSALGLIGGTIFGLQALSTEGDLEDMRDRGDCGMPPCPVDPGRRDDLARQRDLADLMFATAVVAGVTAGILYWRSGSGDTAVQITVAPSQAGIQVVGRF
ncbi:hypothetical protein [Haliangium sp.]